MPESGTDDVRSSLDPAAYLNTEAGLSAHWISDRMKGGTGPEGDHARVHGVRLADYVTDNEPITLEEYRRRQDA